MNISYGDNFNIMFFDSNYRCNQTSVKDKLYKLNAIKDEIEDDSIRTLIYKTINILENEMDSSIATLIDYEINRNNYPSKGFINTFKNVDLSYGKFYDKYKKMIPNIDRRIGAFISLELLSTFEINDLSTEERDILKQNLRRVMVNYE